jgi:predicted enzyme related to lactoylglutathione lyase
MTEADSYSHGMPCWVDTWQPDVSAARDFYAALFGWQFEAVPLAGADAYLSASLRGRAVAGIGPAPAGSPAVWTVSIRVTSTERVTEQVTRAAGHQLIGPIEVADQGRLAIVADSTGVAFGTWEARRRTGAQVVGVANSWAMSALHTTDLDRSEKFYGEVFGWELVRRAGSGLCEWRLGGRMIGVATATDGRSVPAHWAINFAVADVDAFADRAQSLGAALVMAPMNTPGFRSAVIGDPQGAVFAVSAPRD